MTVEDGRIFNDPREASIRLGFVRQLCFDRNKSRSPRTFSNNFKRPDNKHHCDCGRVLKFTFSSPVLCSFLLFGSLRSPARSILHAAVGPPNRRQSQSKFPFSMRRGDIKVDFSEAAYGEPLEPVSQPARESATDHCVCHQLGVRCEGLCALLTRVICTYFFGIRMNWSSADEHSFIWTAEIIIFGSDSP